MILLVVGVTAGTLIGVVLAVFFGAVEDTVLPW